MSDKPIDEQLLEYIRDNEGITFEKLMMEFGLDPQGTSFFLYKYYEEGMIHCKTPSGEHSIEMPYASMECRIYITHRPDVKKVQDA